MTPKVTPQQEDWMEKRTESIVQTFQALFKDFTEKHSNTVEATMNRKFNGNMDLMFKKHEEFRKENQDMYVSLTDSIGKLNTKIDAVDDKVNSLKTDTAPLVEGKNTFSSIFKFVLWSSPLAIIYGALKWAKLL